ncbi:KLHL29 [Branchiostoma lanceolatum]|uniref:KLHL29 protein n=1 Tax=Branchiostoma lanceolatum TaxID=7740 RepID=A0A8J9VK86_BRALA|nr:KLHL29 [Branchiostoma lanceolatum]
MMFWGDYLDDYDDYDDYGSDDHDWGYDDYGDDYFTDGESQGSHSTKSGDNAGGRHFRNYQREMQVLEELNSQRKSGEFLDVVVEIEGREFPCHRAVLASTPYFKAMLSSKLVEGDSRVIKILGVDSISFSKLLDFIYTGEIDIGKENVQDILQAAHMLHFEDVQKYCIEVIEKNLDPSNCLGVLRLAELYNLETLKKKAWDMALQDFTKVTAHEEINDLTQTELLNLLKEDNLKVNSEDDVLDTVLKWVEHDLEHRKEALPDILAAVRLQSVKTSALKKAQANSLVKECRRCSELMKSAQEMQVKGLEGVESNTTEEVTLREGKSDDVLVLVGGWRTIPTPLHMWKEEDESDPQVPLGQVLLVDPDNSKTYHVTDLPADVMGYMSVAVHGSKLYVTGGCVGMPSTDSGTGIPSNQAFCYDFPRDKWGRLPNMPHARCMHCSIVLEGKLYVLGGSNNQGETMDCLDLSRSSWSSCNVPYPHVELSPTITICNNELVLVKVVKHMGNITTMQSDLDGGHEFHLALDTQWTLRVQTYFPREDDWVSVETEYEDSDEEVFTFVDNSKVCIRSSAYYQQPYIFNLEDGTLKRNTENPNSFPATGVHYRLQQEYAHSFTDIPSIMNDAVKRYSFKRFEGHDGPFATVSSVSLPYAVHGSGFSVGKKRTIGWFCRDLEVIKGEDDDEENREEEEEETFDVN